MGGNQKLLFANIGNVVFGLHGFRNENGDLVRIISANTVQFSVS